MDEMEEMDRLNYNMDGMECNGMDYKCNGTELERMD